jgi:NADH:ubiquinone oxidoreductase subunit 4 (subunit M)
MMNGESQIEKIEIYNMLGEVIPHPPLLGRGAGGEVDASWNEKLASVILLLGIVAIGIAPSWLNDLIRPGAEIIIQKVMGK